MMPGDLASRRVPVVEVILLALVQLDLSSSLQHRNPAVRVRPLERTGGSIPSLRSGEGRTRSRATAMHKARNLRAKVPMLFIYGDSDPWVPVTKSVARLQSLIQQRPDIEYAVVADANHEMMIPGKETMQADANTNRHYAPQVPAYFVLLGSWLSRRVARQ